MTTNSLRIEDVIFQKRSPFITIGINGDLLLVDFFLYPYEAGFILDLLRKSAKKLALSSTFR